MTRVDAAADYIKTRAANNNESRFSRHGIHYAVNGITGKKGCFSRKEMELIAKKVGGSYQLTGRRGYIYI